MNAKHFAGLAALMVLAPGAALWAHHGTAGSYDQTKTVTISGVVKEFRWRNPHSALFIAVKDKSGEDVVYSLEMGSPNTLTNAGMNRKIFKPGDQITVKMHPSFTNPTSGESLTREGYVLNGKQMKEAPGREAAAKADY